MKEAVIFAGGSIGKGVATLNTEDRVNDHFFNEDITFASGKEALQAIKRGKVNYGCGCDQCSWLKEGITNGSLVIGEGIAFASIVNETKNLLHWSTAFIVYANDKPEEPVGSIAILGTTPLTDGV